MSVAVGRIGCRGAIKHVVATAEKIIILYWLVNFLCGTHLFHQMMKIKLKISKHLKKNYSTTRLLDSIKSTFTAKLKGYT